MNASVSTSSSTSVSQRTLAALTVAALALVALIGLVLALPDGARAARPAAPKASATSFKSRFDRLSINGIHGGVLVRGSILPGSRHGNAHVALLLRQGTQGSFKNVESIKLGPNDRNFAFLDHLNPGHYGVQVRFKDPGHATAVTSNFKNVTVTPIMGFPMTPGSFKVSGGSVTYSGSVPHPKNVTQVQLLGLDLGPVAGTKGKINPAANTFKVLDTTTVNNGTGTVDFTLKATVKQGERWAFVLERSFGHISGIDYVGLRTAAIH